MYNLFIFLIRKKIPVILIVIRYYDILNIYQIYIVEKLTFNFDSNNNENTLEKKKK